MVLYLYKVCLLIPCEHTHNYRFAGSVLSISYMSIHGAVIQMKFLGNLTYCIAILWFHAVHGNWFPWLGVKRRLS